MVAVSRGPRLVETIRRAQEGNQRAIAVLYRRFRPLLERYLSKRMGARIRRWVEPKEIAHTTLFEVCSRLPEPSEAFTERDLRARLHRVARCLLSKECRRHSHTQGESAAEGMEVAVLRSPLSEVQRADEARWLREQLRRLSEQKRKLLLLRILEGHTFVEIGREMRLGPDAARKQYDAALERLRWICRSHRDP